MLAICVFLVLLPSVGPVSPRGNRAGHGGQCTYNSGRFQSQTVQSRGAVVYYTSGGADLDAIRSRLSSLRLYVHATTVAMSPRSVLPQLPWYTPVGGFWLWFRVAMFLGFICSLLVVLGLLMLARLCFGSNGIATLGDRFAHMPVGELAAAPGQRVAAPVPPATNPNRELALAQLATLRYRLRDPVAE